ncbi:MAG: hypothetical protein OEM49_07400 [Myxococcales bacterium]|nr:hypothetical protein [Myxococcales bacterium]MDH5307184.1 hypothetical protein [Myxococcales bacterium]
MAGGALSTLLTFGCAGSDLVVEGGRLRHPRQGYSVAIPSQPPWTRISADDIDLAYRAPGAAFMSLQSRCNRPLARPQVMARHLVIGLPERVVRQAGPVGVGEWPGWVQVFDTLHEGAAVRVKTVTIVAGRCTFDWVLSARAGFEQAEPSFDAWWQSFEYEPGEAAVGRREEPK